MAKGTSPFQLASRFGALGQGENARQAFGKSLAIAERLAQAEPGEDARQAFAKSLAIAERLAKAEPDRADYQRDLIVSWVEMSEIDPGGAREHLSSAFAIASALQDRGQLMPADAWMVDALAQRLAGLAGQPS